MAGNISKDVYSMQGDLARPMERIQPLARGVGIDRETALR